MMEKLEFTWMRLSDNTTLSQHTQFFSERGTRWLAFNREISPVTAQFSSFALTRLLTTDHDDVGPSQDVSGVSSCTLAQRLGGWIGFQARKLVQTSYRLY